MSTFDLSQQAIYSQLCDALKLSSSDKTATFEILLESHPLPSGVHVLVEGDGIGIPKRSLRKAYLVAREKFFNELGSGVYPDPTVILPASTILLLYEPEHLTAANARKRVLEGVENDSPRELGYLVRQELWFLNSLFQSHLNRHTKSPTLWAHRRWLMRRFPKHAPLNTDKSMEINVVTTAARIHPKNYYAWDYLRWWTNRYPQLLKSTNASVSVAPPSGLKMLTSELPLPDFVQDWCLMNPSDTSGWSFLLFTLIQSTYEATSNASQQIAMKVLDRAVLFKMRNESLWFFLRSLMLLEELSPEIRQRYIKEVRSIAQSSSERPRSRSMADAILKSLA
jgi:protein prenyltransferase alpha subunit repeat containing protein 1